MSIRKAFRYTIAPHSEGDPGVSEETDRQTRALRTCVHSVIQNLKIYEIF